MANLHGISEGHLVCQHLSLLYPMRVKEAWAIFNPRGLMGHEGTCPLVAGIHLSSYYGSTAPLYLTFFWTHYEIYLPVFVISDPSLILLPGPFARFGGPCGHLGMSMLFPSVSPLFILGPILIPSKKGAETNAMCS